MALVALLEDPGRLGLLNLLENSFERLKFHDLRGKSYENH